MSSILMIIITLAAIIWTAVLIQKRSLNRNKAKLEGLKGLRRDSNGE